MEENSAEALKADGAGENVRPFDLSGAGGAMRKKHRAAVRFSKLAFLARRG